MWGSPSLSRKLGEDEVGGLGIVPASTRKTTHGERWPVEQIGRRHALEVAFDGLWRPRIAVARQVHQVEALPSSARTDAEEVHHLRPARCARNSGEPLSPCQGVQQGALSDVGSAEKRHFGQAVPRKLGAGNGADHESGILGPHAARHLFSINRPIDSRAGGTIRPAGVGLSVSGRPTAPRGLPAAGSRLHAEPASSGGGGRSSEPRRYGSPARRVPLRGRWRERPANPSRSPAA